jgi:uncharacterized phage protein (TIGR01671 family)
MREILFRGKREDNGEWVYGYYVAAYEKSYIFTGKMGLSQVSPAHRLMYRDFARYEVIPETVGQFTGLKDKNGVNIFEGDIVLRIITDSSGKTNRVKCFITFERGCFMITRIEPCPFKQPGWSFHNDYKVLTEYEGYFEVIGNIHDNRDLLEQDKE